MLCCDLEPAVDALIAAVQWRLTVRTFTCNERDELTHTFLHALFGFFGDLRILGQRRLHDPGDWSKVMNVSILIEVLSIRVLGAML